MNHKGIEIAAFTRVQTEILKGIGILIIVLHNFFHNLAPIIGENQFSFHPDKFSKFYSAIADNSFEVFRATFSYFGHYGVQIFIFFSAYGLTRKYFNRDITTVSFLKSRAGKIYASFLLCVFIYICLGVAKEAFITNEQVLYWDSLLWKILLLSNFIPNQSLMPVGPWWFMPFIFQFYLFYPLLLELFRKFGAISMLAILLASIITELFLNPYLQPAGLNLNFTIVGHLPVLCAGIYFGSQKRIRLGYGVVVLSAIIFILGNYSREAWLLGDLTFTLLAMAFSILVIDKIAGNRLLSIPLAFYGGISFHLFMVNGFLRSTFHIFAETHNIWWVDILAALTSLTFSTLFALILSYIDRKTRQFIASGN